MRKEQPLQEIVDEDRANIAAAKHIRVVTIVAEDTLMIKVSAVMADGREVPIRTAIKVDVEADIARSKIDLFAATPKHKFVTLCAGSEQEGQSLSLSGALNEVTQ